MGVGELFNPRIAFLLFNATSYPEIVVIEARQKASILHCVSIYIFAFCPTSGVAVKFLVNQGQQINFKQHTLVKACIRVYA